MPRKGENIRKRSDGRWEGRYPNGVDSSGRKKYASVYARSYAEAKTRLFVAKGKANTAKRISKRLFGDVLTEWLDTQALSVKPSTYVKFRNLINGHIQPALGGLSLEQITTARLTRFMQEKADHGRLDGQGGLSNSTLQALLLILKSTLEYAAHERYMPPMALALKCPETKIEPVKALSVNEQSLLEQWLQMDMDISKLGILLCLYSGLRIGEICALRWGDVDLPGKLLFVRRAVQRLQCIDADAKTTLSIGPPKSENSTRSIPIPPCLMELLPCFYGKSEAYILTGTSDRPMEPRTYQYRFKRYLAAAGVPDINFHVLRHTFATRCIELGFDPKTLSEILGHASVEITLNKYVHPSLDVKRQQMERFSAMRGQISGQA
jgi:integrase